MTAVQLSLQSCESLGLTWGFLCSYLVTEALRGSKECLIRRWVGSPGSCEARPPTWSTSADLLRDVQAHWESWPTKWMVGSLSLWSKLVESEMRITCEEFLSFTSGLSIRSLSSDILKKPSAAASCVHVGGWIFKNQFHFCSDESKEWQ